MHPLSELFSLASHVRWRMVIIATLNRHLCPRCTSHSRLLDSNSGRVVATLIDISSNSQNNSSNNQSSLLRSNRPMSKSWIACSRSNSNRALNIKPADRFSNRAPSPVDRRVTSRYGSKRKVLGGENQHALWATIEKKTQNKLPPNH